MLIVKYKMHYLLKILSGSSCIMIPLCNFSIVKKRDAIISIALKTLGTPEVF